MAKSYDELPLPDNLHPETHPYIAIFYGDWDDYKDIPEKYILHEYSEKPEWYYDSKYGDYYFKVSGKSYYYHTLTDSWDSWTAGNLVTGGTYASPPVAKLFGTNFEVKDQNGDVIYSPATITGINISCPDSVPSGGLPIYISASVSGEGDFDPSATCTISGATASTLTNWGANYWQLLVGEAETAESITVTIASVQDPSFTASKTITVIHSGSSGGGSGGGDGPDGPDQPDEPDEPGGTTATPERLERAFWSGYAAATALRGFTSVVTKVPAGNGRSAARSATAAAQLRAAFWKGFAAGCAV